MVNDRTLNHPPLGRASRLPLSAARAWSATMVAMVMGNRPDVETATPPLAVSAVAGLGLQMANALVSVPARRPWEGAASLLDNVGASVTHQVLRTFMGYSLGLRIPEFRSMELVLDTACRVVMPPVVRQLGVTSEVVGLGGVPGTWYRPTGGPVEGTILYLHGGGYVGTSPNMYAAYTALLARESGCEVFVADYRLAPEFPFPAGLEDAVTVYEALLDQGVEPERLFVAGDSGGGGLANSLMLDARGEHLPAPAGLLLLSPEVDLTLDEPSVTENAEYDILPWNIPVGAYLHGLSPQDARVSTINADLSDFPPTFVAFGDREMFRDPIRRFVDGLTAAGVGPVVIEAPDMFHVFPILMPWAEISQQVNRMAGTFVRDHLPEPGPDGPHQP